ncbi:MAG TPA: sugar phosphate isomerase/epimerase [Planctomycetota bacterium]|nr:sugar phosphate isomerase/epimerase [Planctomycetota bacterium]
MSAARLSLSTVAFRAGELVPALEWAARLGLPGVEVGSHHAEELQRSPEAAREATTAFQRLGLRPLSVHAWTEVEGLGEVCPFTAELGAGLIVVHCPHEAIVTGLEAQVAALRRWDGWCRERGITLTVENASRQPLAPFVELFQAVPALAMTLDIKHAYKPETLGLTHADYLRELGDRVANLHLCGIDRSREELGDGCPPGRDAVDWAQLAADLAARGYAGLATVELAYPEHLSGGEIERAYAGLRPVAPDAEGASQRLSAWGVEFFREKLAGLLTDGPRAD